jgi:GNAT superfamily N-acetyltransferase
MVRSATPSEEAAAIAVVVLAFSADPIARWVWPDPGVYLTHFPTFVKAFGGRAFAEGAAHTLEGYAGTALWLPPGVGPDEETMGGLLERTVPAHLQRDLASLLEQMERFHPKEPLWYLPLIGVDPARQGRGVGSALLRHALALCDRDKRPAYLESGNPKNVPLYQRHGFEPLGTIQAGSAPTMVPMLRKPHS